MSSLIYYTPGVFLNSSHKKDVRIWLGFFNVFQNTISFIDRTGNIQVPVKTSTLPENLIPQDSSFNLSFPNCAIKTAERIYSKQKEFNVPIKLHWSGGIDSSAALTSFINLLGMKEASKTIQIVMSSNGIYENPYMWKIIRKEGFEIINSLSFENNYDGDYIAVNGEGGDQVHGTDIYRPLIRKYGSDIIMRPWTENLIKDFIGNRSQLSPDECNILARVLINQVKQSNLDIKTMGDFFWWLNFSCKWTSTFYRMITKSINPVNRATINTHFFPFYASPEFQLWSMYKREEKHKGDWNTYKWKAKEYVCNLIGEEYALKHRQASLCTIWSHTPKYEAIDCNFNLIKKTDAEYWYNPNNSFLEI
jgi:hypothetical protein